MYAIVFGSKRFYQYGFDRHVIVQTDHKPLGRNQEKILYAAPARLQKMLLQLQKLNLEFQHLPDALSMKFSQDTYPEIVNKGLDACFQL